MQVSKKKINRNLKRQIYNLLFQVIADIKDHNETEELLKDLLSDTEIDVVSRRLAIAYYLSKGRSYENIKTNLAVSSTTIASVSKSMKKKGFQLALKHIEAEEWAKNLTEKIGKIVKFSHK